MKNLKVLVVDDSKTISMLLKQQLEEFNYEVTIADCGDEALNVLARDVFDVVITDLRMPGKLDGIQLLEIVKENYEHIEVLIITGHASVETAIGALRKGALDYIMKPYRLDEILIWLERIARKKEIVVTLQHAESNREKGFSDLDEIISMLYEKCLKAEKILRSKNGSDRNRIEKALNILSSRT